MLKRVCYETKVISVNVVLNDQRQYLKAAHEAIFDQLHTIEQATTDTNDIQRDGQLHESSE
jgi:hypothetical protein